MVGASRMVKCKCLAAGTQCRFKGLGLRGDSGTITLKKLSVRRGTGCWKKQMLQGLSPWRPESHRELSVEITKGEGLCRFLGRRPACHYLVRAHSLYPAKKFGPVGRKHHGDLLGSNLRLLSRLVESKLGFQAECQQAPGRSIPRLVL